MGKRDDDEEDLLLFLVCVFFFFFSSVLFCFVTITGLARVLAPTFAIVRTALELLCSLDSLLRSGLAPLYSGLVLLWTRSTTLDSPRSPSRPRTRPRVFARLRSSVLVVDPC